MRGGGLVLGLALPVLLAQRRHPASHAGVRSSENSPGGIQAALIAYLLLARDVIQLQAGLGSLPAAVLCLRFSCNTSHKDGVGPLYLRLCNAPQTHTHTQTRLPTPAQTPAHAPSSHARRHCIRLCICLLLHKQIIAHARIVRDHTHTHTSN